MKLLHALTATLILAAPALAQDGSEAITKRTPASAQKFLLMHPSQWITVMPENHYEITAGNASDACTTTFAVRRTKTEWVDNAMRTSYPDDPRKEIVIAWGKVPKLETINAQPNYNLDIRTRNGVLRIYYTTAEERDRVFQALEYLRTACDASAETGF